MSFTSLPYDIIIHIAGFLEHDDICNFERTNREIYRESPMIWKSIVTKNIPILMEIFCDDSFWKYLYFKYIKKYNNISTIEDIMKKSLQINDVGTLDILLDIRPNFIKAESEDIPLIIACNKGYIEMVEFLIYKGADVNTINAIDMSPLNIAIMHGFNTIAKILINAGADISLHDGTGYAPLHCASKYGNTEIVRELLERGANIDQKTNYGYTALHIATIHNNPDGADILLNSNANIDERMNDIHRQTSLHRAINDGHYNIINVLLKYKANVNIADSRGNTALHRAYMKKQPEIIDLIIRAGGDLTRKNHKGLIPENVNL